MADTNSGFQGTIAALLAVIVMFLLMGFLKLAGAVLIPFVIALLLSFILNPVVEIFIKIKIPRIIAIIIVLIILVGISFLIGLILFESIQSVLADFPKYQQRYFAVIDFLSENLNLSAEYFESLEITRTLLSLLAQTSSNLVGILGDLSLVLVFLLFLFMEKPFIRRRLLDAIRFDETERIARIFSHITRTVSRYLLVKVMVSGLTAIIVFIGFTLIGVDFAFIWAIMTFMFNFIPTIGSITITGMTTIFSIVQFFPQIEPIVLAFLAMAIPQMVIGNIIDPKMLGDSLNLSPVIILVAMLIWGYLWGISGLFLAVPLTVGLKIVFEHFSNLRYLGILMGTGGISEDSLKVDDDYPIAEGSSAEDSGSESSESE